MTAAKLKYFATFIMVLDHIGWMFQPMVGGAIPQFYLLRYVGRIGFPIFVFFVAEGCRKTGDFKGYLYRLAIFGGLSHAMIYHLSNGVAGSVIATLFFGALSVYCHKLVVEKSMPAVLSCIPLLGCCILAIWLHTDYGALGVIFVYALALCNERRTQLLCVALFMGAYYLTISVSQTIWALLALIPLSLYNGERGRMNKWFFYVFYPAHLAVLFGIKSLLGGIL